MARKLCLLCCRNFRSEVSAAVAAEGWPDVVVAEFPARCGHLPLNWDELRPLLETDCDKVIVLGRACLKGLDHPPPDWPSVHLEPQEECFQLVAGATLVSEAISRGAYLMTPGWLDNWRGNLREMGFDDNNAASFFHDFASELLLLDTGVDSEAARKLAELAKVTDLPASRLAVGLDYTRLQLGRIVAEWRLAEENRRVQAGVRERARELADHVAAMDVTGRLAFLKDEGEVIAAIEEMFHMLFAPKDFHYLRFEGGQARSADRLPTELSRQVDTLERDWSWTDSGTGFLLRIRRGDETLAVIIADRLAFPNYRDRYLNLALSVAGVCGLAIENARTYRRIKATEEALRKSEYSLKIAQSIAHLGHWEWDVATGEMKWSDETYRILGYEPQIMLPSHNSFLEVIHPDDREKVASLFGQPQKGSGFDIEFRIILPDGKVRVVHGMGSVLLDGPDTQPRLIGTLQDVTAPGPTEVLGVIQDITERKELELKLAREAHTDALTGCANRRHFLELARQELGRIRRYGGKLSVLALDLDHFKSVNDRYGHHVGDLTLQTLVEVCRDTLREEDVVGRLGGEEFCVLLPETGRETAIEVAERLRRAVADADVYVNGKPLVRFTTSIGAATATTTDLNIDRLLDRADQALYEAKDTGRNRVVAAPLTTA
jgi:diguanylate cyclase (GGDEF)-like protein/PAS domain S-box-containing protein